MEPLTHPVPASPPSQEPTLQDHVLCVLAALAGILPAAGVAYAGRSVINVFQGMAIAGSGGIGAVAIGLYESNRPLVVAAIMATLLAASVASALLFRPGRSGAFPGVLLSVLVPVAACVPAFLLWSAEAFTIEIVAGRDSLSVAAASSRLANLLTSSFLLSLALGGLVAVAAILSLLRSRPRPAASPRFHGAVWVATTLLLAAMAASFYLRSSYFYEVAMRGSL